MKCRIGDKILLILSFALCCCGEKSGDERYAFHIEDNGLFKLISSSTVFTETFAGDNRVIEVNGVECGKNLYVLKVESGQIVFAQFFMRPDRDSHWGTFDPYFMALVDFLKSDRFNGSCYEINEIEFCVGEWCFISTPYGVYNYIVKYSPEGDLYLRCDWYAAGINDSHDFEKNAKYIEVNDSIELNIK